MTPLYVTIDGVQKELASLPGMVDGVQKDMSSLLATVDGVAREVFSAGISGNVLANYAEGDIVYINEDGTPVEFYVACHNYESGLNGAGRTLLVRKEIHSTRAWHSTESNVFFRESDVCAWLNDGSVGYISLFSDYARSLMSGAKIYDTLDFVTSTPITVSAFLLAHDEIFETFEGVYSNEGSLLPTAELFHEIVGFGYYPAQWYLRSLYYVSAYTGIFYRPTGDSSPNAKGVLQTGSYCIRPAITLLSTAQFDPETHVLLEGTNDSSSDLPSGYTKCNYIQSSTTAYFNTNYVPTHNTRVVLKCKILEVTANGWVFGSRTSSQSNQFDLFCETGGTSWRVGIGNKQTMISAGTFLGEHTFDISKDGAIVDGVTTAVTYGEFTGAQPIYLCGGNNGGTFFTGGHIIQQVEECQIYESGVLVHDYVPCMNMSGVYGLYDKNTGEFGGSSGSGAFTGG